jgi:vacuolar protein sorting-associated protein 45
LVQVNNLIHLSAIEQETACEDSRQEQFRKISIALTDPGNPQLEKLRLVLLYSVRYANDTSGISQLKQSLSSLGIDQSQVELVDLLRDYAVIEKGATSGDRTVATTKNVLSMMKKAVGLTGVENVYTQHKSLIHSIADSVVKGKLKDTQFPQIESKRRSATSGRPNDAIIFVIGGTNFEEARDIRTINSSQQGINFVLGGSTVHNSKSFLADIAQLRRVKAVAGIAPGSQLGFD